MQKKNQLLKLCPVNNIAQKRDSTRISSKMNTWILIVTMILVIRLSSGSFTALANYNFYGLSPGTTKIPCTIDSASNIEWEFAGKKFE